MDRRAFLALLAALAAAPRSAAAKPARRVYRLGILAPTAAPHASEQNVAVTLIPKALREMGYVEGQNIAIEHRYAEGGGRAAELAAELVRLKVDIILVAVGGEPIQAAKNATKTIPIVMVGVGAIQSRESG